MGTRDQGNPPYGRPIAPSPPSHHYGSPGAYALGWSGGSTPPTPIRQELGLRCRTYLRGRGILTPFPFGGYQLGPALGPAHSRLTTIAGKPLPFRRGGFSPPFAITAAGICTRGWSSGPLGPPSDQPWRLPTEWNPLGSTPRVSVAGLSPDQSLGPPASAGELLRTP